MNVPKAVSPWPSMPLSRSFEGSTAELIILRCGATVHDVLVLVQIVEGAVSIARASRDVLAWAAHLARPTPAKIMVLSESLEAWLDAGDLALATLPP